MSRFIKYLIPLCFLLMEPALIHAGGGIPPAVEGKKVFYATTVIPAITTVKKAMPQPPEGWIAASDNVLPAPVPDESNQVHFHYQITFRRVAGVQKEKTRLNDAFTESSRKHNEEAKPLIEKLIDQQSETARALRKATRNRNQLQIQRLNEELDENGRKMKALHDDIEGKIAQEVEPYLVKDAEASIEVSINDAIAVLPDGKLFTNPDTAFAIRKEGGRVGATGWNEGQIVLLYGDWRQESQDVFRAKIDQLPFAPKAKTIKIVLSGDRKRMNELSKQMDLNAILSLMK
jgi:hypothetical protein